MFLIGLMASHQVMAARGRTSSRVRSTQWEEAQLMRLIKKDVIKMSPAEYNNWKTEVKKLVVLVPQYFNLVDEKIRGKEDEALALLDGLQNNIDELQQGVDRTTDVKRISSVIKQIDKVYDQIAMQQGTFDKTSPMHSEVAVLVRSIKDKIESLRGYLGFIIEQRKSALEEAESGVPVQQQQKEIKQIEQVEQELDKQDERAERLKNIIESEEYVPSVTPLEQEEALGAMYEKQQKEEKEAEEQRQLEREQKAKNAEAEKIVQQLITLSGQEIGNRSARLSRIDYKTATSDAIENAANGVLITVKDAIEKDAKLKVLRDKGAEIGTSEKETAKQAFDGIMNTADDALVLFVENKMEDYLELTKELRTKYTLANFLTKSEGKLTKQLDDLFENLVFSIDHLITKNQEKLDEQIEHLGAGTAVIMDESTVKDIINELVQAYQSAADEAKIAKDYGLNDIAEKIEEAKRKIENILYDKIYSNEKLNYLKRTLLFRGMGPQGYDAVPQELKDKLSGRARPS